MFHLFSVQRRGAAHDRRGSFDQLDGESVVHENLEDQPAFQAQEESLAPGRAAVHARAANGRIQDPLADLKAGKM